MEYVIEIEIDHSNIGCSRNTIRIDIEDSVGGVIALARYFKKMLGDVSVSLWKDTSVEEYTKMSF